MDVVSLIGQKFGRLTVVGYSHQDAHWHTMWECICECGNTKTVARSSLTRGLSKSCGCSPDRSEKKRKQHKVQGGVEYKHCYRCDGWLELSAFFKNSDQWDGLSKACKSCFKKHRSGNEQHRKWRRDYVRQRRMSDPAFRILLNLRDRIVKSLKGISKSRKTMELLDCSIDDLKTHLEGKFTREMNWENYGSYWHVDHIRPCASFDLSDPEQQRICFNYKNLQPLEAMENMVKSDNHPYTFAGKPVYLPEWAAE